MESLTQAASASYYLGHCSSHRSPFHYYNGGDEPDGKWWNPTGLFGLEDGADIDPEVFQALYSGLSPDDGTPLTKSATLKHRSPGLDLTFSADKSISALWAIADPKVRADIEACHHDAVRLTLETITQKHCAYTRRGQGGKEVLRGDILGVTFEHHTSRDNDPQLHTHSVIFNLVRTHDDGQWRSHHQRPSYQWVRAGGAVYRHALAWNLQQRLHLQMERYGHDDEFVRIAGIPEDLIKAWSTRRQNIERLARKLNIDITDSSYLSQELTLSTRARKDTSDPVERDARFHQEAALYIDSQELIQSLLGASPTPPTEAQIRDALDRCRHLPRQLTVNEAVFSIPTLIEHIARETPGIVNPEGLRTMLTRILRDRAVIALDEHRKGTTADARAGLAHTRLYSTLDYTTEERAVREAAQRSVASSGHAIAPETIERRLNLLTREGHLIGDQQRKAVHHLAGSDTSVAVCLGAAGAGKTVALRPVAELYRERDYRVIATAFSWHAAVNLANEVNAQPYSLARLFTQIHSGQTVLTPNTVLIVDEAGTLSIREMRTVLDIVERSGAKVLFVGDLDQLQPIEAGPGLRLVVDQIGAAKIDTIRRQRPDLEDLAVWRFGLSCEAARAHVALMSDEERGALLADRDAYPGQGWQAQASDAIRKGHAEEAIQAYVARERLHLESSHDDAIAKLAQDWIAYRKQHPDASALVVARTHREVRKLSSILRAVALPPDPDRPQITITASRGDPGKKQTFELDIARGDLLRIGTTVFHHQLFNGTIVTVTDIAAVRDHDTDRARITATTEDGRDVTFYADEARDIHGNIRLEHSYALTIASAQGLTVDRTFFFADDRPSRETVYPALTRHRDRLDVYIDTEPLTLAVRRLRPEEDWAAPVTHAELYNHLAYRWSRDGSKEAALDYASETRQGVIERRIADQETRRDAARLAASLHPTQPIPADPSPANVEAQILARLTRRGGAFTPNEVRFAAWAEGIGRDQLDDVTTRVLTHCDVMPLYGHDASDEAPRFTTVATFAAEEQLARRASRLRSDTTGPAPPAPRHIKNALRHLSPGARAAAQTLLASRRLTLIARPDDHHRRTAIRAALGAFARSGTDVIRCGADRRSLRLYDDDTPTYTVYSLLNQLARGRPLLSRTSLIVVNQAEALDTDTLYTLVRVAADAGVRLALVGDQHDQPRSPVFPWLTERFAPVHAASITPPTAADLLHRLDRNRNLIRVDTDEALTDSILTAWRDQESRSSHTTQLVVTSSAETAERFNTLIQHARAGARRLGQGHRYTVLRPAYTHPDGSPLPSRVVGPIPDTTDTLTVHVGDRIRILENHSTGLSRGDIGTVRHLSSTEITVDVDGTTYTFNPRRHNRFTLGYAASVYQRPPRADHVHAAISSAWNQPALYRAATTSYRGLTVHWRATPGQTLIDLARAITSRTTPPCSQFYLDRQRAIVAAHRQPSGDHPLKTAWHLLSNEERTDIQRRDHDHRVAIHTHQQPRDATAPWLHTAKPASIASAVRDAFAYRTEGAAALDYQHEYDTLNHTLSRIRRTAQVHGQSLLDTPEYPDTLQRLRDVAAHATARARSSNIFRLALAQKTRYTADDLERHQETSNHELRAHHLAQESRNMSAYFNARALGWSLAADALHAELADLEAVAQEAQTRSFLLDGYAECHPRFAELEAQYRELARIRDELAAPNTQLLDLITRFDTAAQPFLGHLATHNRELQATQTVAAYKTARDAYRHHQDDLHRYQSARTTEEQHAAARAVAGHHRVLETRAAEIRDDLEWLDPHLKQAEITVREIEVYAPTLAGPDAPALERTERQDLDRTT